MPRKLQIKQGTIVRSDAGHDQNRFYVVVSVDERGVYIADGKRRKLSNPKLKNPRHVTRTNQVLQPDLYETNLKLRRVLRCYNQQTYNEGAEE